MERKSFASMNCSVAQFLEVAGDWWTMLIVRDAFLGVTRFDQFEERLGISRNVLTQRLGHLVATGILEKVRYSERPARYDYVLSAKGRDLWPVLTAMRQWGDRYAAPEGPPVEVVHRGCGQVTTVVATCGACGEALRAPDVEAVPGPGARGDVALGLGRYPSA